MNDMPKAKRFQRALIEKRIDDLPLFDDWGLEECEPTEDEHLPANEVIERACAKWIDEGGFIVPAILGANLVSEGWHYVKVGKHSERQSTGWRWQAETLTSPFGALLHGTKKRIDWLADTVTILQIEPAWVIGFLHGFDNLPTITKPDLDKSPIYRHGREAGVKIRNLYAPRLGDKAA